MVFMIGQFFSNKLFIASTCALGLVFGGYYALNADKEFTSVAIFKLNENNARGISLNGEISALASLAGLGGGSTTPALPIDQVNGRIFIEKLDAKLNFQADPYFNTYSPNSVDPIWKSLIKNMIGWQKSSANAQEAIWQNIVEQYSKKVLIGNKMAESEDLSGVLVFLLSDASRYVTGQNIVVDGGWSI